MARHVDAVLIYEHDTDWAFLRLETGRSGIKHSILDRAEAALRSRDDYRDLIEKAEDQGNGTSRLELGTVVIEGAYFGRLNVTA